MIKGTQLFVYVSDLSITDLLKHIPVVFKTECVIHTFEHLIHSLSDINFDLRRYKVCVIHFKFPLRQVNAEGFKFVLKVGNVLFNVLLVMVKLKQTELGQIRDQILQFVVKGAHGFPNRVFLLKNFFPHTVKSRVINFEQIFDFFLLVSHFSHKS